MEDSQLNPNELSSRRVHLDLKVRNDYNNEKNLTPAHASEPFNEDFLKNYDFLLQHLQERIFH